MKSDKPIPALAEPAVPSQPSASYVAEVFPDPSAPSCHVCGALMVPDGFKCLSCKATTKPASSQDAPLECPTCGCTKRKLTHPDSGFACSDEFHKSEAAPSSAGPRDAEEKSMPDSLEEAQREIVRLDNFRAAAEKEVDLLVERVTELEQQLSNSHQDRKTSESSSRTDVSMYMADPAGANNSGRQQTLGESMSRTIELKNDDDLFIHGKAGDPIWCMENVDGLIGVRLDCGDSGVVYLTHDQAKELGEQLTKMTERPSSAGTEPPNTSEFMHEDELPPMSKAEYHEWYKKSWIPGGVGVRVGPIVRAAASEGTTPITKILRLMHETIQQCTVDGKLTCDGDALVAKFREKLTAAAPGASLEETENGD